MEQKRWQINTLRMDTKRTETYQIKTPKGDWFVYNYILIPLYILAEINARIIIIIISDSGKGALTNHACTFPVHIILIKTKSMVLKIQRI